VLLLWTLLPALTRRDIQPRWMKEQLEQKSSADSHTRHLGSQFTPGILDEVPIHINDERNKSVESLVRMETWCVTNICVLDELNEVLRNELIVH